MSFLKQQRITNGQTDWSRADLDRAPFRGPPPPLMREEEYENLVERVWDTHYGTFDSSQPDQMIAGRTLQDVLDGWAAGLYRVVYRDHRWVDQTDGPPVMYQYIEWAEPYMEYSRKDASNGKSSHAPPLM